MGIRDSRRAAERGIGRTRNAALIGLDINLATGTTIGAYVLAHRRRDNDVRAERDDHWIGPGNREIIFDITAPGRRDVIGAAVCRDRDERGWRAAEAHLEERVDDRDRTGVDAVGIVKTNERAIFLR